MARRIRTAVLLSLLVVLAGCSALGGDDVDNSDGGDGIDNGDANNGDGALTTTSTDSSAADAVDGEDVTLVENRTAALRAAGGFTSVWKMESSRDGEVVGSTSYTHAVDYENKQSSFSMLMRNDEEVSNDYENFQDDGVSYTRYGTGEDATYNVNDAVFAPDNTLFSVESSITDVDDLSDFTAVGTETYDGVTVMRYERTDRPTWVTARSSDDEFTWTKFTYTVLVDENGLVRSDSWGGEGVTDDGVSQTMEFSYSLTDVGSTTVEEPDWVETAREQAEQ